VERGGGRGTEARRGGSRASTSVRSTSWPTWQSTPAARLGWVRAGEIPGYVLLLRGGLGGTAVFYRPLSPSGRGEW